MVSGRRHSRNPIKKHRFADICPVVEPGSIGLAEQPAYAEVGKKCCRIGTGFFDVELFLESHHKFQARYNNLVSSEAFELRFKPFQGLFDDAEFAKSGLAFTGAEARSSSDAASIVAHYEGECFDADVNYVVRRGDHVLQKHIVFRNIKRACRLRRLSLFTHTLSERYEVVLHEAGMFYPVLFYRAKRGGLFFCADFPCYFAELEDENFRFDYYPSATLEPGRSFQSLSAIVGVYPLVGRVYANPYHEKGALLDLGERVWFRAYLQKQVMGEGLPYLEMKGPEKNAAGPSDLEVLEQCSWFGACHVLLPRAAASVEGYPSWGYLQKTMKDRGLIPKFLWSRGDVENLRWLSMDLGGGSELPESRAYFAVDAFRDYLVEQHLATMEKHGFREVEVSGVPIVPHYTARRFSLDRIDRREMLHEAFQSFADVAAALKETFGHVSATGNYSCYGAGLVRLFDATGVCSESHPLALPDLHIGRLYADGERFSFRYHYDFLLPKIFLWNSIGFPHENQEKVPYPGAEKYPWYLYHDRVGWRYALISALATGLRHRFYPVPMDFSEEDKAFARKWLSWERENSAYLRETEPIFEEPGLNAVDGYSSARPDGAIIFLFNNSYDVQEAILGLNLPEKGLYLVREIYPKTFNYMGPKKGYYAHIGDVRVVLEPREAKILEVIHENHVDKGSDSCMIFGAEGELRGSQITLLGKAGTTVTVGVCQGNRYKTAEVVFPGETPTTQIKKWAWRSGSYEQHRDRLATGDFEGKPLDKSLGMVRNVWLSSRVHFPGHFAELIDSSPFRLSRPCWSYLDRLFMVVRFEPSPIFDTIRTGSEVEEIPETFLAEQKMKTGIDLSVLGLDMKAWINGRQCAVYPAPSCWNRLKPNPCPVTAYFFEAGSKLRFGEWNNVVLFCRNFDMTSFRGIYLEHVPETPGTEVVDLTCLQ